MIFNHLWISCVMNVKRKSVDKRRTERDKERFCEQHSTLPFIVFFLSFFCLVVNFSWCYRREQMRYGKTPMNKAVDLQKLRGLTNIG
jgi:hypothetical protein